MYGGSFNGGIWNVWTQKRFICNAFVYINLMIPLGYAVGKSFWKIAINKNYCHVAIGHLVCLELGEAKVDFKKILVKRISNELQFAYNLLIFSLVFLLSFRSLFVVAVVVL